jgi:hypothetical protein
MGEDVLRRFLAPGYRGSRRLTARRVRVSSGLAVDDHTVAVGGTGGIFAVARALLRVARSIESQPEPP